MMRANAFVSVLLVLFFPGVMLAHAKDAPTVGVTARFGVKPDDGQVQFKAIGKPSALKIVGKGRSAEGQVTLKGTIASGTLSFNLTTLETGIALRDKHMKEKYLEVGKYPTSTLKFASVQLPAGSSDGDFTATGVAFSGTLNLHGVDRPVSGTVDVARAGASVTITAQLSVKITDFGITVPTFAGITVADTVDITVQAHATVL